MSWSDCFLRQSKYFDQLSHKNKTKTKVRKRFVGVTEKYQKTEKPLNTMGSYQREINVQNALEYF